MKFLSQGCCPSIQITIEEFIELLDGKEPWKGIEKCGFTVAREKGDLEVSCQTYSDGTFPWQFRLNGHLLEVDGDYEPGEGLLETALSRPEVREILSHL